MTVYLLWWLIAACAIALGALGVFRAGRHPKRALRRRVSVLDSHHTPLVVYRSSWFLRSGKGKR